MNTNLLDLFKNDGSYYGRRKLILVLFQCLAVAAALINSIFAVGWLEGIVSQYLPVWLSTFLCFMLVIGLEFLKKTTAVFFFKEWAKHKIIDIIGLAAFLFLFILTTVLSLNGIDAKAASDELKLHLAEEQADSNKSTPPTLLNNQKALPASSLREQTKANAALASLFEAATKADSLKVASNDKKTQLKKDRIGKIMELKNRLFDVGKGFIIGVELFFLFSCICVGVLLSAKPETYERPIPTEIEIKQMKARYSAARSRYKKDSKDSDKEIMNEIEEVFSLFGFDLPAERP